MVALSSWPTVSHQINTTADPNDPAATNTWVDVTSRVDAFNIKRGRSDELADVQVGTMDWTCRNLDGLFDPANSASALYPYLLPNRQAKSTAQWPPLTGTVYPIGFGYEEKGWPLTYLKDGRYGYCNPSFLDAIAPLGTVGLTDIITSEMLVDNPTCLYPLDDPAGSTSAVNVTGTARANLIFRTVNSATFAFGQTAPFPVVPTGLTGLLMTLPAFVTGVGALVPAVTAGVQLASSGVGLGGSGVSVETWLDGSKGDVQGLLNLDAVGFSVDTYVYVSLVSGKVTAQVENTSGTGYGTVTHPTSVNDGQPHHVLVTQTTTTTTIYVDGTAASGSNASTPANVNTLSLGAQSTTAAAGTLTLGMVAVFPVALSSARVTAHYQAGKLAGYGDTVGQRVTRVLNYIAWLSGNRSIDTASSGERDAFLQAVQNFSGSTALSQLQAAADSANALLDVDATGKVRYRSRDYKSLQTAPVVTFGENSGEVPYLSDIAFGVDPSFLYAVTELQQANGATILRSDATAVRRLFARTLTKAVQLSDINLVADFANMFLRIFKNPAQRCTKLTVEPSSNPACWPQILGLDVGMRVRVNRRQAGAPLKTVDCYIEGITHTVTQTSWQVSFLMSSVPTLQGWILGDSTYGVLGSTSILTG